jgi:hypothetical protein
MDQRLSPKHVISRIEKEAICDDGLSARVRARRSNISRYRRLLNTKLSELERQYIERRLSEEQMALNSLANEGFLMPANLCSEMPSAAEGAR